MRAVVVALGKVGLPLAAKLTLSGHEVVGCDIDAVVVDAVNSGTAPFPGEAGLDDALRAAIADGVLRATTDTVAAIADHRPELIVAVPPLYVDEGAAPDWAILDAVTADIGRGLAAAGRSGTGELPVVAIETTVPVGATRERISPGIEAASGGLAEAEGFHTAFSPERVFSGRALDDLDAYPKLVGGLTAAGEERAVALYRAFISAEVRAMGSAEAAELAKLAETTYRDINIAFANELARYADRIGVDVLPVIDAANSQPYSHIHRPGIAVGGHCIPVYPRFLLATDPEARLPRVGRQVNEEMPAYAASLLGSDLIGQRVLILGAAYRGGVKETAFSGVFPLARALRDRGADVLVHDPLYGHDELTALGLVPWDGETPVDAAVVQADHPQYRAFSAGDLPGAGTIVDGRGVLDPARFPGVRIRRIGRPDDAAADGGSTIAPDATTLEQRPV
ncbi:MAG: nucleotide sugar dehydrogenase [Baekduia sp.]